MLPKIAVYDPKTYHLVAEISSWAKVNASFNISLTGGGSGYFDLELVNEYGETLPFTSNDFFEMSHYVKFGTDSEVVPGVVSSCEIINTGSILRIHVIGAMEYFSNIDIVPFYRASQSSVTLSENDESFTMMLYGNNVVSILNSLLTNNYMTLNSRGIDPFFIQFSDLASYEQTTVNGFTQSFRINGFETKSLSSCIQDIISDHTMQLLEITTSQNINDRFSFVFNIKDALEMKTVNFNSLSNPYTSISFDSLGKKVRTYSIAQGTDLMNRQKLERKDFNNSVAYSSLIGESSKSSTEAVETEAQSAMENAQTNRGTFSFTSDVDEFKILDYLVISGLNDFMEFDLSGVVTEKEIEGRNITYKVQVSPQITKAGGLSKPETMERKLVFNPLYSAENLSRDNAKSRNKKFITGWRQ